MRSVLLLLLTCMLPAPALAQRTVEPEALARALLSVPEPSPRGDFETTAQYRARVNGRFDGLAVQGVPLTDVLRVRYRTSVEDEEVTYDPDTEWMVATFAGDEVQWTGGRGRVVFNADLDGENVVFVARDTVLRAENEYACATSRLNGYYRDQFIVPLSEAPSQKPNLDIEYDFQVVPPHVVRTEDGETLVPVRLLDVRIVNRYTERVWSRVSPELVAAHEPARRFAAELLGYAHQPPRHALRSCRARNRAAAPRRLRVGRGRIRRAGELLVRRGDQRPALFDRVAGLARHIALPAWHPLRRARARGHERDAPASARTVG